VQLKDVDLTNPDIFESGTPHETFKLLRNEAPVFWHEERNGPGFWTITKHADLQMISKTPEVFSSEKMGALLAEPDESTLGILRNIMLNMDPPKHRQHRALINAGFTPRMVNALHAKIEGYVTEIIDAVIEKGECDFVEDLASPLPMLVICEMMGVPEEDRRRIYEIGNSMVGFDDPELQEDGKPLEMAVTDGTDSQALFAEMFMYADKLREKALTHPEDNIAAALVNVEVDGEKLSKEEFQFFFMLLLIAGNETTRTVTSNGMIQLIKHRDQLDRWKNDMSLTNSAVEEILRFDPAVHCFRRQTLSDTVIRGQEISAGQKIALWYPAVNRDEDVFENPDVFDVGRTPNDHLSFGVGEHFCLGSNLARLELREIFKGLVSRIDDIDFREPPRRLRSNFINGVKEMQVTFKPGPRSGA
jgi:cholest-4-en-3-one 26-monooxygenase